MPRRFGTTVNSRPCAVITRHTSAHQRPHLLARFQRVNHEDAIEASILERQFLLLGEGDEVAATIRPVLDPLVRRHHRDDAFGLFAERAQERRGITEAENPQAGRIGPYLAHAAADHPTRDLAEARGVEMAKIDDVRAHGGTLPVENILS